MEANAKRFAVGMGLLLGAAFGFSPLTLSPPSRDDLHWGMRSNCKATSPPTLDFTIIGLTQFSVTISLGKYAEARNCRYFISVPDRVETIAAAGRQSSKDDQGATIEEDFSNDYYLRETDDRVISYDGSATEIRLPLIDNAYLESVTFSYSPRLRHVGFGLYVFSASWAPLEPSDDLGQVVSEINGQVGGPWFGYALQNNLNHTLVVDTSGDFHLSGNGKKLVLTFFEPLHEFSARVAISSLAGVLSVLLIFLAFVL
jgi:hypothetical protein